MPATYSNEFKPLTIDLLLGNANSYLTALGGVFRMPFGLSRPVATVVVALMLIGIGVVLTRRDSAEEGQRGLRDYLALVPLSLWYLAAYVGALLFAPAPPQLRYLLPVLPFVAAFAATGAFGTLRQLPRQRLLGAVAGAMLSLYYLALHVSAPRLSQADLATCGACGELYAFIHDCTAPGTLIAFAKPRAMALLGGRPGWAWSPRYSPQEFELKARAAGVSVLVLGAPGSAWAKRNPPASLEPAANFSAGPILFRNATFIAFKIDKDR